MMDRRDFLKRSAAVSAAGAAGMAQAAAQDKALRCGLLGINHAHAVDLLKTVLQSEDYEVAGVCEPDAAVRAQFERAIEKLGVRWITQDELLGDESVEMVAIESDVPRLLPLARAAVEAGKHLHLDKPAGTSLPEFRALLDEAERRGLLVQMGYMFRYNPGFDLIRRAVGEGWLGSVYAIDASMSTDISPEKRARMAFHPGGLMLELGCHLIDLIVLLLGAPAKVTPFLRHDAPHEDALADNTLAVLEYANALVTVASAAMEPGAFQERRFKICGTEGCITLSPLEAPAARLVLREAAGGFKKGAQSVEFEDLPRHRRDVSDLARAIRGESAFAYSKEHDYAVQRTILRACGMEL